MPNNQALNKPITEKDFENLLDEAGVYFLDTYAQKCFTLAQQMCQAKDREIERLMNITEICPSCQDDENKMPCQLCDNAGRIPLKSQPIAEGEVVYRKISVKERLPKTEGWYTIFLDDLSQAAYFNTEDFSPTPKMDLEDENDNIEASHWLEPITIPQSDLDHIPDTSKLVKTMSVEEAKVTNKERICDMCGCPDGIHKNNCYYMLKV